MAEILKVANVSFSICQNKILDNVSFSINEGEIFGLLGPNGSGKSTLMKVVNGLLEKSGGQIFIAGKDTWMLGNGSKKIISMVPQEPAFFNDLSVDDNLAYFASQTGQGKEKARETMFMLGLGDYANMPAKSLSGGYRQMLNIAIALMQSPKLIFLDEPSVGLDPVTRSGLWDRIFEIQKSGTAVCISTHYMEEAYALCNRVCLINEGKVVALDSSDALIAKHAKAQLITITLNQLPAKELAGAIGEKIPEAEVSISGTSLLLKFNEKNPVALEKAKLLLAASRMDIIKVRTREADLEQVFINLTGKELKGA